MTKTDKKIDELIDSPQTNQTVQQGRCDELATDSSSADDSGEVKTGDANSDEEQIKSELFGGLECVKPQDGGKHG